MVDYFYGEKMTRERILNILRFLHFFCIVQTIIYIKWKVL